MRAAGVCAKCVPGCMSDDETITSSARAGVFPVQDQKGGAAVLRTHGDEGILDWAVLFEVSSQGFPGGAPGQVACRQPRVTKPS